MENNLPIVDIRDSIIETLSHVLETSIRRQERMAEEMLTLRANATRLHLLVLNMLDHLDKGHTIHPEDIRELRVATATKH